MTKRQRRDSVTARAEHFLEWRRLNRVAVHEKERVGQKMPHALQRAAGAEDFFFAREVKGAVEGVREIALDEIGKVMEVDDDLVGAGAQIVLDRVRDERLVAQGHERLGQRVRDRAKARAEGGGAENAL